MLIIGDSDNRVTHQAAVHYYRALKSQGSDTKMYMYPGQGHGIVGLEQNADAYVNIFRWFDQYLLKEDVEKAKEEVEKEKKEAEEAEEAKKAKKVEEESKES
jgi:hypothetical protein